MNILNRHKKMRYEQILNIYNNCDNVNDLHGTSQQ